jgi:hypothetical protein
VAAIRRLTFAACIGLATAACGYTDAGVGSKTLEVNASLQYTWETDSTRAEIWLTRAGTAVTDANVVLLDADSHQQRPVANALAAGHYAVDLVGYPRRLQLSVRVGDEGLACQIEGPGRHLIAAPAPGTTIGYGEALSVQWKSEDGVRADSVTVRVADIPWSLHITNDQGHAAVPAHVLMPGIQTLTVERRSQVIPNGGAGHSHVDMVYAVSTPFQVRAKL